jgi:hypothetical protein
MLAKLDKELSTFCCYDCSFPCSHKNTTSVPFLIQTNLVHKITVIVLVSILVLSHLLTYIYIHMCLCVCVRALIKVTVHELGIWTFSCVRILKNTTFRKLDLFPPSGERRETPTLLGPSERANLNHWKNICFIMFIIFNKSRRPWKIFFTTSIKKLLALENISRIAPEDIYLTIMKLFLNFQDMNYKYLSDC